MSELNFDIVCVKGSISFSNFDEVLEALKFEVSKYKTLVFTEDNLPEAKQTRAALNKVVDKIDTRRKEIKKHFLKPYEELEKQFKEMKTVIEEANFNIDRQVKMFEEKQKLEKKSKILEIWDNLNYKKITLDKIYQESWLNKTVTLKSIQEAIKAKIEEIDKNIEMITHVFNGNQKKAQTVIADYLQTLDVNLAIQKSEKDEKAKDIAKSIIEDLTSNVDEDNVMYKIEFEVTATKAQITNLSNFLKSEKITYRRVK